MKMDWIAVRSLGVGLLGLLLTGTTTFGQSEAVTEAALANQPLLQPSQVPKYGNFYSLAHPEWPPIPDDTGGYPVWQVGSDSYVMDDATQTSGARMTASPMTPPPVPGGGTNSGPGYTLPQDISNYAKYLAQSFTVVNTNDPTVDTNVYNACTAFSDTSTNPLLQIATLGNGTLVMKAAHFEYSAESRNFCVVVCDELATPLYKAMDLYQPSNNIQSGGWLVQGSVSSWQVTDPMYMVVSNISTLYNAFFQVVPYGGPVATWVSTNNPYDVVSNTVTLQASVMDLSGVTNETWSVNLDGAAMRYTLGASNTFTFDTKYNQNGVGNIDFTVNNQAQIIDTNNLPDNEQVFYSGGTSMALDFENDQYLAFASDWCPPEAGTNYIYYYLSKAEPISCVISSPDDGRVVATYTNVTPGAGTVAIPWTMTEADGVTPYSNDTYVVTFTAYDPVTWVSTNNIDKGGNIRVPAGTFLTYVWEDPSTVPGNFLDTHADNAIAGNLLYLYQDIYDQYGLTEYYDWMVGPDRDWAQCLPYNAAYKSFNGIMQYGMTNSDVFSDLTMAQGHGSGPTIGGGEYLHEAVWVQDFARYVSFCNTPHNWRLRKACLFTCYNADIALSTAGQYVSWPGACGIRPTGFQQTSLTYKNCGLFFVGGLPQGYVNAQTSQVMGTSDVAEMVDQAWVCGANEYPGGCDPTYSFEWAVRATMGLYPDLATAVPALAGYPLCVYDAWQDEALRNLNTSGVKTR